MYRQIGELTIDPNKSAGCDSILVDYDDSQEPMRLRVSFFKNNHYHDEAVVGLVVEEDCVVTDADAWKYRCLELAAQLDIKDFEKK